MWGSRIVMNGGSLVLIILCRLEDGKDYDGHDNCTRTVMLAVLMKHILFSRLKTTTKSTIYLTQRDETQ